MSILANAAGMHNVTSDDSVAMWPRWRLSEIRSEDNAFVLIFRFIDLLEYRVGWPHPSVPPICHDINCIKRSVLLQQDLGHVGRTFYKSSQGWCHVLPTFLPLQSTCNNNLA